jgi:tRNA (guanine-N7-)-methyltransferase
MEHRNFYGRIKGKALNAAQERYLEEDLPKLRVGGISRADNPARSLLDMRHVAAGKPLWLEIGFRRRRAFGAPGLGQS